MQKIKKSIGPSIIIFFQLGELAYKDQKMSMLFFTAVSLIISSRS